MIFDKTTGRSKYDPTDQELADFANHGTFYYREPGPLGLLDRDERAEVIRKLTSDTTSKHIRKRKLTFDHMDSSKEVFFFCAFISTLLISFFVWAIVDGSKAEIASLGVLGVIPLLFMIWSRPRYKNVKVPNPDYSPYPSINPFT